MLGSVPEVFPIHHLSFFSVSEFIPRYVIVLQCFSAAVVPRPAFAQGLSDTFLLRLLAGFQMLIYTCAKGTHRVGGYLHHLPFVHRSTMSSESPSLPKAGGK